MPAMKSLRVGNYMDGEMEVYLAVVDGETLLDMDVVEYRAVDEYLTRVYALQMLRRNTVLPLPITMLTDKRYIRHNGDTVEINGEVYMVDGLHRYKALKLAKRFIDTGLARRILDTWMTENLLRDVVIPVFIHVYRGEEELSKAEYENLAWKLRAVSGETIRSRNMQLYSKTDLKKIAKTISKRLSEKLAEFSLLSDKKYLSTAIESALRRGRWFRNKVAELNIEPEILGEAVYTLYVEWWLAIRNVYGEALHDKENYLFLNTVGYVPLLRALPQIVEIMQKYGVEPSTETFTETLSNTDEVGDKEFWRKGRIVGVGEAVFKVIEEKIVEDMDKSIRNIVERKRYIAMLKNLTKSYVEMGLSKEEVISRLTETFKDLLDRETIEKEIANKLVENK